MLSSTVGQCQDARAVSGTVGDRKDVPDPNIGRERHCRVDHAPAQRITAVGEYEQFLAEAVAVGDDRPCGTGRGATGSTVHHHDGSV